MSEAMMKDILLTIKYTLRAYSVNDDKRRQYACTLIEEFQYDSLYEHKIEQYKQLLNFLTDENVLFTDVDKYIELFKD